MVPVAPIPVKVHGWYSPNYNNKCHKYVISLKHPTTINICECKAILSVLLYIEDHVPDKTKINVFTD